MNPQMDWPDPRLRQSGCSRSWHCPEPQAGDGKPPAQAGHTLECSRRTDLKDRCQPIPSLLPTRAPHMLSYGGGCLVLINHTASQAVWLVCCSQPHCLPKLPLRSPPPKKPYKWQPGPTCRCWSRLQCWILAALQGLSALCQLSSQPSYVR